MGVMEIFGRCPGDICGRPGYIWWVSFKYIWWISLAYIWCVSLIYIYDEFPLHIYDGFMMGVQEIFIGCPGDISWVAFR